MIAYVKKEWIENIRNYKLLILVIIFMFFGISNAVIAKLTPELLQLMEGSGIVIFMPDPTGIDSWIQFYKNMSSLQLLLFLLLFGSILSNEYQKGTLVMLFTKGLKRSHVILSKFINMSIVWSIVYWLCFVCTLLYTMILFPNDHYNAIFSSAFFFYVVGIFFSSVLLLGAVLFKNMSMTLLFTGGIYIALSILSIFEKIHQYSPFYLGTHNLQLLMNDVQIQDFMIPFVLCILSICLCLFLSVKLFNKKRF